MKYFNLCFALFFGIGAQCLAANTEKLRPKSYSTPCPMAKPEPEGINASFARMMQDMHGEPRTVNRLRPENTVSTIRMLHIRCSLTCHSHRLDQAATNALCAPTIKASRTELRGAAVVWLAVQ